MTRILVHVEWRAEVDPDVSTITRDEQWARLVGPLFDRVVALGGRLISSGLYDVTVDFSWDGLYDAIDFLVDAPLAPELAAGMCHGDLTVLHDGGRLALTTGAPLRIASELAELARPGEVLISPELVLAAGGRLATAGRIQPRVGRPQIEAFMLDPESPLTEVRSSIPPSQLVPNGASNGVYRLPEASIAVPASAREGEVGEFLDTQDSSEEDNLVAFPSELPSVLRRCDVASLQELAALMRGQSASDAADRLDAMAQLADGNTGDAIRRLRRSKERSTAEDASTRCRSALALAVALASTGRTYEAVLECLEGVARAREGGDERGERACAKLLSQLSLTLRDAQSAKAWGLLGA